MPDDLIEQLSGKWNVFEGTRFVAVAKCKIRRYQKYEESTDLATGVISRAPVDTRYELDIVRGSEDIPWGGYERYTLHTDRKNELNKLNFSVPAEGRTRVTGGWF